MFLAGKRGRFNAHATYEIRKTRIWMERTVVGKAGKRVETGCVFVAGKLQPAKGFFAITKG